MKKFNIDLSKIIRYVDGQEDRIIRGQLIRHGLYNQDCLYSVFNGDKAKQPKKTGSYRDKNLDSIFALTKDELVWESGSTHNSLKSLSDQYPNNPAIAIYDKKQFFQDFMRGTNWEYFFKNPDKKLEALLGIAFLRF
jgi:PhoPQ-activated pathogenicity-related protein